LKVIFTLRRKETQQENFAA